VQHFPKIARRLLYTAKGGNVKSNVLLGAMLGAWFASALAVGGLSDYSPTEEERKAILAGDKALIIEVAKKHLTYNFKDPGSAQYRNVVVTDQKNVCGEVNGKNAYGAYVGFRRFYVIGPAFGQAIAETEPRDKIEREMVFDKMYEKYCPK
jgi:hypothetical protein